MTSSTMQLLAWAQRRGPDVAQDVAQAIALAQDAHHGQFRYSGDPYIEHLVAVALILSQINADPPTVVAGVLHRLATTSAFDPDRLRESFGAEVADLLDTLQVADRIVPHPPVVDHDRRALQIKVAHRLHNMRTIRYVAPASQLRKAMDTHDLIAPLARSLGLAEIGDELDSLAASTLHAHAAADSVAARPASSTAGVRAFHSTLAVAARLLPLTYRHRWVQEWDGELHAAGTVTGRLRFTLNVLAGLPAMAVIARARSQP